VKMYAIDRMRIIVSFAVLILLMLGCFGCKKEDAPADDPSVPIEYSVGIIIAKATQRIDVTNSIYYEPKSLYDIVQEWDNVTKRGGQTLEPYVLEACTGFLPMVYCNIIEDALDYKIYSPVVSGRFAFLDPWNQGSDAYCDNIKAFAMLMKKRNYNLVQSDEPRCYFTIAVAQQDEAYLAYSDYDNLLANRDVVLGMTWFYRLYNGPTLPWSCDGYLPCSVIYARTIDKFRKLVEKKVNDQGYESHFKTNGEFYTYKFEFHVFAHEMGHQFGRKDEHPLDNVLCAMQNQWPSLNYLSWLEIEQNLRTYLTSVCVCNNCLHSFADSSYYKRN